jgi:biopolymer transport protein ExbD
LHGGDHVVRATTVVPRQLAEAAGIIHQDVDVASRHAQRIAMDQYIGLHGVERLADRTGNHVPVDASALEARMREAAARTPQPDLHLRADQQVVYRKVAEVMAAAQQSGLSKIGFVTDPRPAPTPR